MANISVLLCLIITILVASGFANGSGYQPKEKVGVYELKKGDLSVKFTNWGATIISLILPDKNGLFLVLDLLVSYEFWFYLKI